MSTPKFQHGQRVFIHVPRLGHFSGSIRKIRGRWWFCGDVCRGVKFRLADRAKVGWRFET